MMMMMMMMETKLYAHCTKSTAVAKAQFTHTRFQRWLYTVFETVYDRLFNLETPGSIRLRVSATVNDRNASFNWRAKIDHGAGSVWPADKRLTTILWRGSAYGDRLDASGNRAKAARKTASFVTWLLVNRMHFQPLQGGLQAFL